MCSLWWNVCVFEGAPPPGARIEGKTPGGRAARPAPSALSACGPGAWCHLRAAPGRAQASPRSWQPCQGSDSPLRATSSCKAERSPVPGGRWPCTWRGPNPPEGELGDNREGPALASPPVCLGAPSLPNTSAAWTPWHGVREPPRPHLHSSGGGRRGVSSRGHS